MRIIQLSQDNAPGYPYYVARTWEGRFKGMYPPGIENIPSMRRKWDAGGLGSGKRPGKEYRSEDPADLLQQLRQDGISPAHDHVDFYVVRTPGAPRAGIRLDQLIELSRHP